MSGPAPIMSRRVLGWLIGVGVAAFAGALYLAIFGGAQTPGQTAGANAFSHSAIGHRAFVETLRRLDIPVLVSRHDSVGRAGRGGLLVLAEPRAGSYSRTALTGDIEHASRVLLVLPKWRGVARQDRPSWLATAELVRQLDVAALLRILPADIDIRRRTGPLTVSGTRFGTATIERQPQLLVSNALRPLVVADGGILVGELRQGATRIVVLSDPDVLSNHGIGVADNAAFTVALVESLLAGTGGVVLDETIHGFRREPSLWRALFEFPLVIATVMMAAAVVALLWAATGRFGAPLPLPPPLAPGKAGLIDNTARLLLHGGHGAAILGRYLRVALRDVARRRHAPPGLDDARLLAWLDSRPGGGRARLTGDGVSRDVAAAMAGRPGDDARLVRAARRIHRWRQEMLDGGRLDGGH